ncbi:MAG TPA: GtrA family protein [bacterium]|nr:GtrA family protein [bacterium]
MKNKKKKNGIVTKIIGEVLRYLTSGGIGMASDFLILYLLVEFTPLYLLISVSIASIGSTIINYTIQKIWTFKSHVAVGSSFLKYAIVFTWNYFFTLGFMYVTVEMFNFNYLWMKAATYVFITIWTYFMYKYFVYNNK